MKGIPKHINTKRDLDVVRELFPEAHKQLCQQLLDSSKVWETIATLDSKAVGETTTTMRVIDSEIDGESVKLQQELQTDSNAKLFKLGLTVKDVENAIAGKIVGEIGSKA